MESHVAKAFEIFDGNKDEKISLNEFLRCVREADVLLFPVFQLQLDLREKTLVFLRFLSNFTLIYLFLIFATF